MRVSNDVILNAAELIKKGGLVAFPTETVYGLGADALNPAAVAKIFEAKKRPFFDPLICHISDIEMLKKITDGITQQALDLIGKFWPGPLTLVLPKAECVPALVTSGLPTVAVRMPDHPVALELIKHSGTPIAAPSANPFGYLSPTTAEHVRKALSGEIDYIIDGGKCSIGVESTIISLENNKACLLRPGGLEIEEIEKLTGKLTIAGSDCIPSAPGLLPSHYAPGAKLILIEENAEIQAPTDKTALLNFGPNRRTNKFLKVLELSHERNLNEAAVNLFEYLHQLDYLSPDKIYAEKVPQHGLGIAIMNRLQKAAF
ncbi:MAG: threonylcarbamoyl-AMP synthase [Spirochaetes bacterium]|nr:threonylcarbamoyl-AMP synthase [Spirochaetota bacterium]